MEIALHDAGPQLSQLIDRATNGEDIVLVRDGRPVVRMVPVADTRSEQRIEPLVSAAGTAQPSDKLRAINAIVARARPKLADDLVPAERSQDFLYDEHGLPK